MRRTAVWGGLAVLVTSLVSGCGQMGIAAHVDAQASAPPATTQATTTQATSSSADAQPTERPQPATAVRTKPHAAPQAVPPAEQFSRARATMVKLGYDPGSSQGNWHPDHELNGLAGSPTGSNGHPQQVFFFVNGDYIGTDTSEPSQGIVIADSGKDAVTVRYALFGPNDAMCCPKHFADVSYRWDGNQLIPANPIPSATDPSSHR